MSMFKLFFMGAILTSISLNSIGQSASQQNYSRLFSVTLKKLSAEEYEEIKAALETNEFITADQFCPQNESCLIAVDASYPKRISEIENEIRNLISTKISKKRIERFDSVSVDQKMNFCP